MLGRPEQDFEPALVDSLSHEDLALRSAASHVEDQQAWSTTYQSLEQPTVRKQTPLRLASSSTTQLQIQDHPHSSVADEATENAVRRS